MRKKAFFFHFTLGLWIGLGLYALSRLGDCSNPAGNSGGPLIGACGVVRIVIAISDSTQLSGYVGAVSEQGIGYAISAKVASERFKIHLTSSN